AVNLLSRGLLREAEADHVGHDDPVPGREQRRDHLAPEEAPGGIAVQQHHRIAAAVRADIDIVHPPAVHPRLAWLVGPCRAHAWRQLDERGHASLPLSRILPAGSGAVTVSA